jgi:Uma2 family endonuclease
MNVTPGWLHQRTVMELGFRLRYHCPPHLEVLAAPFRVVVDNGVEPEPDLVVVRRTDFAPTGLRGAPLLAVEVWRDEDDRGGRRFGLTAGLGGRGERRTQRRDTKRVQFERAGTPSFWFVDPTSAPESASVQVWELADAGRYRLVAYVTGEECYRVTAPFPVMICPADLVP